MQPDGSARRPAAVHRSTTRPVLLLTLLAVLAAAGVGGCAPAAPTGSPASGEVRISVQRGPGARELYNAQRRARIVAADGTVAFDGTLAEDAVETVVVPVGSYTVSALTVFFGDFLQCASDPAGGSPPPCFQPTLGPSQVCDVHVAVTPTRPVDVRYTVLPDGLCRIEEGPAASSPSWAG